MSNDFKSEIIKNEFNVKIEDSYVDDKILFVGHDDIFNYSKIDNIKFFIVSDATKDNNVKILFYDNDENLTIKINYSIHKIYNGDLIDLRFKDEILSTIIEYNNVQQDITYDIKNIVNNTLTITDI